MWWMRDLQDVATSLGITNLSEAVASSLASDVEYRIHQTLRVLNIESLYGHNPHNHLVFRRTFPFPYSTAKVGPVWRPDRHDGLDSPSLSNETSLRSITWRISNTCLIYIRINTLTVRDYTKTVYSVAHSIERQRLMHYLYKDSILQVTTISNSKRAKRTVN